MKKNLSNSFLTLAVIVFAALGCNMSKNSGATNGGANSWGDNTTAKNTPDAAPPTANMPSSKAAAWDLGDNISVAAILYDLKGTETSDSLKRADILAKQLGVSVAAFPAKTGDKNKDTTAILSYLMSVFRTTGTQIYQKYGSEEAALFEISLKSNLLLLIYSPGAPEGKAIAKRIRSQAKIANLPEEYWLPVVIGIENDATFDPVKATVGEMQTNVSRYLKKS